LETNLKQESNTNVAYILFFLHIFAVDIYKMFPATLAAVKRGFLKQQSNPVGRRRLLNANGISRSFQKRPLDESSSLRRQLYNNDSCKVTSNVTKATLSYWAPSQPVMKPIKNTTPTNKNNNEESMKILSLSSSDLMSSFKHDDPLLLRSNFFTTLIMGSPSSLGSQQLRMFSSYNRYSWQSSSSIININSNDFGSSAKALMSTSSKEEDKKQATSPPKPKPSSSRYATVAKIPTPKSSPHALSLQQSIAAIDPKAILQIVWNFTWTITKAVVKFTAMLPYNIVYYIFHPQDRRDKITEIKEIAKKEFDHYWVGTKVRDIQQKEQNGVKRTVKRQYIILMVHLSLSLYLSISLLNDIIIILNLNIASNGRCSNSSELGGENIKRVDVNTT
jgi:hypothetical protein